MNIFWPLFDCEVVVRSTLFGLIYGLNNNSDTAFIMWIFCVVSIQISNSLLCCMFFLYPIFNKILNLANVHKLNIIDVSVLLSFYNDVWGYTFVTHSFWIRLMIFASGIHFISNLRRWKTVIAFYV